MKKLLVFVLGAGLAVAVGLRLREEMTADGDAGGGPPQSTILVDTAVATPAQFQTDLEILGELTPEAEVEVMSRVSGRLRQVLVDRGEAVRRGNLLATVEDEEILQQIQQAEASMSVAQAGVKKAEATRMNLEVQVRRYTDLHDAGLISPQDLEDLQSRLRVSEADFELAKAQVRQAEASINELKIQLSNTRIFSPLDGVVGQRFLDPGALVSPGVPIASILDLSRVKTVVPVSESVIEKIRIGLPAKIEVQAYPGRTFYGEVTRISPFLDSETRSADIEIETPNPGLVLKPGMFARVNIDVSVSREALSIPRSGLIMKGRRQGVYLLTEQKKVHFQPVEVGAIEGDVVEVSEGLQEGALIVTTGAQSLNDGDQVRTQ